MWRMMQLDKPEDFVVATGETHTVREFVETAFEHAGLDWKRCVEIDPRYFRPTEVDVLLGDASKAERELGWRPKVKFHDLVRLMVDADWKLLQDQLDGRAARESLVRQ
jgi:GDPmannose 4,6-dehydratase